MAKNITIIGGGTGTYVVTRVLKQHSDIDLTKIVAVFDSGGSTARLKDEFGFLPVGDLRQSLAALAIENHQSWIRELLLYRFDKGKGLTGHNLGNLILTALQDLTGSTPQALEVATHIFRLQGKILPITTGKSDLKTTYADGSVEIGEHLLDDMTKGGRRIAKIELTKPCRIYKKSKQAIETADYIIIGPGDIFASILPNFIVAGVKPALASSNAKTVYIVNLMTRFTQTHGYTALDHVKVIEKHIGKPLDYILVNTGSVTSKIEKKYAKFKEYPVINDLQNHPTAKKISGDFTSSVEVKSKSGDKIPRALMRHDPKKLEKALLDIIK